MDIDIEFLKKAFTDAQWYALIFTVAGTMSLTQVFKNVYFGFFYERRKGKKKAIINLFAFSVGVIGSYIGYEIGIPKQPDWFWVLSGCISGLASIGAFKLFIEVDWLGVLGLEKKKKNSNE